MSVEAALFDECARLIRAADGLLIGAGAGMGVDSGLPDFRGEHGFWKAYPALGRAKISFDSIASPEAFEKNPRLAWGFYGHRLKLYRETVPHEGFHILRDIGATMPHGAFVYTSNVDGQFQKAGFDPNRIDECHGSIHHLQCLAECTGKTWPADEFEPEIDNDNCKLLSDFPRCPACDGIARPNVMMFGDWTWLAGRERAQARRLAEWRRKVERLIVIELGAGTDIPSVRLFCGDQRSPVIRINPREPDLDQTNGFSLKLGALEAMRQIRNSVQSDV